jgi:hypothetical protein
MAVHGHQHLIRSRLQSGDTYEQHWSPKNCAALSGRFFGDVSDPRRCLGLEAALPLRGEDGVGARGIRWGLRALGCRRVIVVAYAVIVLPWRAA